MFDDPLLRRLKALDTAALAELLSRRPDAAPPGAEPTDLAELAERLTHPYSLVEALHRESVPSWQLLEAALSLGAEPTTTALVQLLDHATDDDVDAIVDTLHERAVLTRNGTRLHLPSTLRRLFPTPLGLGEPLKSLLAPATADTMRRIAQRLGLPRPRTRDDAEHALTEFFADPANIEQLLQGVPDSVRSILLTGERDDPDTIYYDADDYTARQDVYRWAAPLGLVFDSGSGYGYGYHWRVPAEVTKALRGPDYRAPFTPQPPPVPSRPPRPDSRESAVAATEFLSTLLAVLDHIARHPVKTLKSGGLGTRELTRLVKAVGTSEPSVRLALELADALGVLEDDGFVVTTGARFPAWRDSAPDEQFAGAVQVWWTLGFTPTAARDEDDKPRPALIGGGARCALCRLARHALVDVLAEVGATDCISLVERVVWWRPGAHVSPVDEPLADQWREAELLGVIADGAVGALGHALRDGTNLVETAGTLLPAAAHHATFGSDLTVFVAGSPAARVSSVLDASADREGRGGAITWRFTPATVRRAFDDGATADTLLAELAAVSHSELPQALRYLINDVARQHGTLRLSAATSVVRSDDAPLLAIVAADRTLAKYGVRLLAPSVLAADVPVETLLAALRSAGYFPVVDAVVDTAADAAKIGSTKDVGPPAAEWDVRAEHARVTTLPTRVPEAPDWHALAARIKSGRPATVSSTTERVLARLNPALSTSERRQLARAVDHRGRVGIDYVAASGSRTQRVIAEPELLGPSLVAWCELRQGEREFTVSRIVSVLAV